MCIISFTIEAYNENCMQFSSSLHFSCLKKWNKFFQIPRHEGQRNDKCAFQMPSAVFANTALFLVHICSDFEMKYSYRFYAPKSRKMKQFWLFSKMQIWIL